MFYVQSSIELLYTINHYYYPISCRFEVLAEYSSHFKGKQLLRIRNNVRCSA